MKIKKIVVLAMCLLTVIFSYAQIGYQVSLLNNATGEPRANEQVDVTVKITDRDNKVICEQTRAEVTNDFGVLSMTVGNSDTFFDADWNKLPFFIEASVDGRMIGKSQILSVPVAEYAKQIASLSLNVLCAKNWSYKEGKMVVTYTFYEDGSFTRYTEYNDGYNPPETTKGKYHICANQIFTEYRYDEQLFGVVLTYCYANNCIYGDGYKIQ